MCRFCLCLLLCLPIVGGACSEPQLDRVEQAVFVTVHDGLSRPGLDPFSRSETLRILELIAADSFPLPFQATATYNTDESFVALLEDPNPMVRLAAVRVALAAKRSEAREAALRVFSDGTDVERREILRSVFRYGPGSLEQELISRSINNVRDDQLRTMAFTQGYLKRLDQAIESGNQTALEQRYLPEMGTFVTRRDGMLAAVSLRKFLDLGHTDRVGPLLEVLQAPRTSQKAFDETARILVRARATSVQPFFRQLLVKHDGRNKGKLGIPEKGLEPSTERWAVLAMVATGDDSFVSRAQPYLDGASVQETLEVLEALSGSASPAATVSIKVAMQDSRPDVSRRALELYSERSDVDPEAMMRVMRQANFSTKRQVAALLRTKFRKQWGESLVRSFEEDSRITPTLRLLQQILTNREEAEVLTAIQPQLKRQLDSPFQERVKLASYLLEIMAEKPRLEVYESFDPPLQYALLEFCVRSDARKAVELFKRGIQADNFSIRLVSAVGLWKAKHTQ